jgi:hypothetical protein
MEKVFDAIVNFFREDEWEFSQVEGEAVLQMGFTGDKGNWMCYAQAQEDEETAQFIFYSVCPVKAPENKRVIAAEFLTRANYGLVLGNFELDFADGEIRYKTSIDVKDDRLSSALSKQLVYTNVLMMDKYLPGIMGVIYGDVSPEQAIAQVENQLESEMTQN